ncbi:hypothetical protein CUMW_254300 [Citrus unshiu]|uniref:Uncharacterized protein n=1 Tax=Citrus unshiu TaxID=55188 RepID=A0A2H5QR95_CITUN|nr:hypothetical protein CUMW_254300 [Citrus unshiu]
MVRVRVKVTVRVNVNVTHYFLFVRDMEENEEPTYDLDLEGKPRRNLTKKKDLQRGVSDETELDLGVSERKIDRGEA